MIRAIGIAITTLCVTATSFTETGDVGDANGTLKRVLTIHATRVAQTSRD